MEEITLNSFSSVLDALLKANPHAKSKGDAFKEWCTKNFGCDSRISHIREQRQTTNRVSEQYRYFSPLVVFVIDSEVKRDVLVQYISERAYSQLEAVAIIGVTFSENDEDVVNNYQYEKLLIYKNCKFSEWAASFFDEKIMMKTTSSEDPIRVADVNLQIIFAGSPGTGKSNAIQEKLASVPAGDKFRTMFHPESDYSSFVGCYKPSMKGDKIVYDYTPQVFVKAYTRAWENLLAAESIEETAPVYLVIEEINRGNCAQIFGDLFQLLDRDGAGFSKYAIAADKDLADHLLKKETPFEGNADASGLDSWSTDNDKAAILCGKDLCLPPNLYIWATMNTSDQGLFPMDSAFKRRWQWKYMPIVNEAKDFRIELAEDCHYDWWDFLEAINGRIETVSMSSDKKLGYWFCSNPAGGTIDADTFVCKVISYLWTDVFKNVDRKNKSNAFRFDFDGRDFHTYDRFFTSDFGAISTAAIKAFMSGMSLESMEQNAADAGTGADASNSNGAEE